MVTLFDLGGVVVPIHSEEAYRRFQALGVDTDRWLSPYGQKGIFLDLETGRIDKEEFLRELGKMAGRQVSEEEAMHAWLGFIDPPTEERLAMVAEARKEGRVVLASNTNPFIMEWAHSPRFHDGKSIDKYFDAIYASCEMGAYKPDASFFEHILKAEGIPASEARFIDDSAANVAAAAALGIDARQLV